MSCEHFKIMDKRNIWVECVNINFWEKLSKTLVDLVFAPLSLLREKKWIKTDVGPKLRFVFAVAEARGIQA